MATILQMMRATRETRAKIKIMTKMTMIVMMRKTNMTMSYYDGLRD